MLPGIVVKRQKCDGCNSFHVAPTKAMIGKEKVLSEKLGMKVAPVFACSRCKCSYYCSKECQKKDWSSHKKDCFLCFPADAELLDSSDLDTAQYNAIVEREKEEFKEIFKGDMSMEAKAFSHLFPHGVGYWGSQDKPVRFGEYVQQRLRDPGEDFGSSEEWMAWALLIERTIRKNILKKLARARGLRDTVSGSLNNPSALKGKSEEKNQNKKTNHKTEIIPTPGLQNPKLSDSVLTRGAFLMGVQCLCTLMRAVAGFLSSSLTWPYLIISQIEILVVRTGVFLNFGRFFRDYSLKEGLVFVALRLFAENIPSNWGGMSEGMRWPPTGAWGGGGTGNSEMETKGYNVISACHQVLLYGVWLMICMLVLLRTRVASPVATAGLNLGFVSALGPLMLAFGGVGTPVVGLLRFLGLGLASNPSLLVSAMRFVRLEVREKRTVDMEAERIRKLREKMKNAEVSVQGMPSPSHSHSHSHTGIPGKCPAGHSHGPAAPATKGEKVN